MIITECIFLPADLGRCFLNLPHDFFPPDSSSLCGAQIIVFRSQRLYGRPQLIQGTDLLLILADIGLKFTSVRFNIRFVFNYSLIVFDYLVLGLNHHPIKLVLRDSSGFELLAILIQVLFQIFGFGIECLYSILRLSHFVDKFRIFELYRYDLMYFILCHISSYGLNN